MRYSEMRSVIILLVASLMVNAEVPSYLQVCKRNDPAISKCIIKSVNALRSRLAATGIPELDVPTLEPLDLDELSLDLGSGFRADTKNVLLTGVSNFRIGDVNIDFAKNVFNINFTIPEIQAKANYNLDAKIAGIPLRGDGPITIKALKVDGKIVLRGKRETRKGKNVIWFPSMDLKLVIGDYTVKLENLFNGDPKLGEATNKVLNENKSEILPAVIPAFEKALSKRILLIANNIVKHFTFEQLFPEK